jgi:adenylate cyclase
LRLSLYLAGEEASLTVQSVERVERRLAAILAADVVGYSRLMGADEVGTLELLRAHRAQLFDPKIAEHRGRIVKTTGDGMLVEFGSVVDAVSCAVEVQRGMVDRNADTPEDKRIEFRIGINLGDVIIDGDDIHGDGVNVAARLEGLAEPGGICVSRTVRNQVRDKLPYSFEDMGEQVVKNIARPVRADALSAAAVAETPLVKVQVEMPAQPARADHRVSPRLAIIAAGFFFVAIGVGLGTWWMRPHTGPSAAVVQAPASAPNPAPRLSIVVLPFTNLSNDPEQDYFVDSITDDLTTDLSRIDGSFVISRTTAFIYKGKSVDVKQIGRDLGVRYVLEGSVRRVGEQVEVNVQLIDAESGAHAWADRFNTDRADLGKAQEEITSRLARTLDIALVQAAGRQIDPEKNPDARDLIMRGWALYYDPQVHWQEAEDAFEKALELDPQSTGAKIALARMLEEGVPRGLSKSREQDMARAEKLITEAVQRDTSADAYYTLGLLHRLQNRLTESRSELEKAISLNRNHGSASLQLGITLLYSGEPELALPHLEQALRLTPNSANTHFYYFWLGEDYLLMNQGDRAVDYLRKACAAGAGAPQLRFYRLTLASALGLRGDIEEAKTTLAETRKLSPNFDSMAKLMNSFDKIGAPKFFSMRKKTLEAGLRLAGMPEE